MIELHTLPTLRYDDEDGPYAVFSHWIPRGGDNARLSLEVAAVYNAKLTCYVYHKNTADVGNGTVASIDSLEFDNSIGIGTQEWLGLKEWVRFYLQVDYSGDPGAAVGWVSFRFLSCVWFEALS